MGTGTPSFDDWLAALVASHQRLAAAVGGLNAGEVTAPSYASEWSIAQVLSHLGSGAEIFGLFVSAGLQETPAPGVAEFEPLWERWNTKSPEDQASDALVADEAFLDQIEGLDDKERQRWHLSMFGGDQTLTDMLRMRLGEHAVHTWDVVVTGERDAILAADATELLVDTLDPLVARTGRTSGEAMRVHIDTDRPVRRFLLVADGENAQLRSVGNVTRGSSDPADPTDDADPTDNADNADQTLALPAEALIRLVYGRLDPRHTPTLEGDTSVIEALRRTFPGF
jgi:uncharacterized protein (TIGR03083 family)